MWQEMLQIKVEGGGGEPSGIVKEYIGGIFNRDTGNSAIYSYQATESVDVLAILISTADAANATLTPVYSSNLTPIVSKTKNATSAESGGRYIYIQADTYRMTAGQTLTLNCGSTNNPSEGGIRASHYIALIKLNRGLADIEFGSVKTSTDTNAFTMNISADDNLVLLGTNASFTSNLPFSMTTDFGYIATNEGKWSGSYTNSGTRFGYSSNFGIAMILT